MRSISTKTIYVVGTSVVVGVVDRENYRTRTTRDGRGRGSQTTETLFYFFRFSFYDIYIYNALT